MAARLEKTPRGEEFRPTTKTGLPAPVIKNLSRVSAWRSTLALAQTMALISISAAAALALPHPLTYVAAILVMTAQQHALAILAHDAVHYRLYEARWLNDGIGRLAGFLVGVSMLTYRIVHRLHHNHLYEPLDPDLALQAGYPRGRAYLAKRLAKDALGLTTFKNYAYFFGRPGRNTRDASRANRKALDDTSDRLKAAAGRDRRNVLIFQTGALLAATATGWWLEYLILWLLPLLTLFQVLLRFRALAEHGAVPEEQPGSDVRRATRTTLAPAWIRWMLFPHHVNYHIEHHLYPAIPHYRLAECHRALGQVGGLGTAEVVSLGQAVGKFFADPKPAAAAADGT